MKKQLGMVLAAVVFLIGLSVVTNAQENRRSHNINAREARQQLRIDQGIASGQLTYGETRRLEREQERIERTEDRYRDSGGGLSFRERVRLERDLNRASRDIYREKHDRETRWRP